MPPNREPPSIMESVVVAAFLAILGLVTGFFAVSVVSDIPGIQIPQGTRMIVSILAAVICFVAGYRFSDKTLDVLGNVWTFLWELFISIRTVVRLFFR